MYLNFSCFCIHFFSFTSSKSWNNVEKLYSVLKISRFFFIYRIFLSNLRFFVFFQHCIYRYFLLTLSKIIKLSRKIKIKNTFRGVPVFSKLAVEHYLFFSSKSHLAIFPYIQPFSNFRFFGWDFKNVYKCIHTPISTAISWKLCLSITDIHTGFQISSISMYV